jgi:hypothetical protein
VEYDHRDDRIPLCSDGCGWSRTSRNQWVASQKRSEGALNDIFWLMLSNVELIKYTNWSVDWKFDYRLHLRHRELVRKCVEVGQKVLLKVEGLEYLNR